MPPITNIEIIKPQPTNVQKLAVVKAAFEKMFGVDQASRTPEQWRNLVGQYGMDQVKKTEKMTEKQIKKKMRG